MSSQTSELESIHLSVVPTVGATTQQIVTTEDELLSVKNELVEKQKAIADLKSKNSDLEMSISLFRTQIGDKQSQINFYEKHIMELQNRKIVEVHTSGAGGDNNVMGNVDDSSQNEEIIALKVNTNKINKHIKTQRSVVL